MHKNKTGYTSLGGSHVYDAVSLRKAVGIYSKRLVLLCVGAVYVYSAVYKHSLPVRCALDASCVLGVCVILARRLLRLRAVCYAACSCLVAL